MILRIRSVVPGLVIVLSACMAVRADVHMPKIFTSHMVLQQELPIPVWGWAGPGEKVSVSFAGKSVETSAGADGTWRVDLPACKADGKSQTLTIKGANTITFSDVLVGEVWLCGGQSNMGRPVGETAAKSADFPLIRLFNSSGDFPRKEGMDDTTEWTLCSPASILVAGDSLGPGKGRRGFTEVGYHFGLKLHQALHVPIGLIQMNCGGSTAADWTPLPEVGAKLTEGQRIEKMTHTPGVLYWVRMRGMMPFSVRGVIWYQGEDDGRNAKYADDLSKLIESWRKVWNRPDLPFYMAQISQTTYAGGMLGVWESQVKVMRSIPNAALAVSNDIYDNTDNDGFKVRLDPALGWNIAGGSNPHPTGKPLVAGRLADIALVKTYAQAERPLFGPIYQSHEFQGEKVRVKFSFAGAGLATRDAKEPDWFELSDGTLEGNRLKYVKAQAKIVSEDSVEVWVPEIKAPKHIRFGWHALARMNLKNKDGLPAVPFRTDTQANSGR